MHAKGKSSTLSHGFMLLRRVTKIEPLTMENEGSCSTMHTEDIHPLELFERYIT